MRKLEVTVAGRWYVALTILLGVVALSSGNNIVYLIESLLLSGLILSGILSERSISALKIEFKRIPVAANSAPKDQVYISNQRRFPIFCVEVGEWKNGRFVPSAFVPFLAPRQSIVISSKQRFDQRGWHTWDALAIATSYPFGFAKKLRILSNKGGRRIIWPEPLKGDSSKNRSPNSEGTFKAGVRIQEGEVRPMTWDDDYRHVVWTLSARGTEPLVRQRRSESQDEKLVLDLRTEAGTSLENRIRDLAQVFYSDAGEEGKTWSLTLVDWEGARTYHGRKDSLDQLALAQAQGLIPRKEAA
jgi:uncharacterized protein (DUF58 family)